LKILLAILLAAAIARYGHSGPALLPDPFYTPGVVRTTDKKEICKGGSTKQFRNTTDATKKQVCLEYGLAPHCYGRSTNEIDHLISLEIGGADDPKNLRPQPYNQNPGAHQKDALENHLHAMICNDEISVEEAQAAIRTDWYAAYLKYVKEQTPSWTRPGSLAD
jgi:hypothetical protein